MPSSEVMHKWKAGTLRSGSKSGPPVKSQAQAVAIMLSEKRKEGQHGGKYPHKAVGGGLGGVPPGGPLADNAQRWQGFENRFPKDVPPRNWNLSPGVIGNRGMVASGGAIPQYALGGGLGVLPGTNVSPLPGGVGSMMPPQGLGAPMGMRAGGGEVDDDGPLSGNVPLPISRSPVLQMDPMAAGMLQRGAAPTQEIIPPSSPNVAAAIKRASAWMQERAQLDPQQPVLQRNIQMMLRGGPMAEAIAKHTLSTFQPHPSEVLSAPTPLTIDAEQRGGRIGGYWADGGNVVDKSHYFQGAQDMNRALRAIDDPKLRTQDILGRALGMQNVLPINPDDKARGGGLGYQFGGSPTSMGLTPGWIERQEARNISHTGPIISTVGGRTDNHAINVPSGSYVLPSAHVSAMGQGNTLNGMQILTRMFGAPMKLPHGAGPPPMRAPRAMGMSSSGGSRGGSHIGRPVPIMAAGGEFVLSPDQVARVGGGDVNHGHAVLDRWVQNTHKKYAKTIANLPPPAKT